MSITGERRDAVTREYVIGAATAAVAVLYAITGWALGHWASVAALVALAAMWIDVGMARRLTSIQREVIARAAAQPDPAAGEEGEAS